MIDITIRRTEVFSAWHKGLRDIWAQSIISSRIERMARGNAGDVQTVGDGVSELRVHYGPGYRIYFMRRGKAIVLLLCGGDKSSQKADIRRAKTMAANLRED